LIGAAPFAPTGDLPLPSVERAAAPWRDPAPALSVATGSVPLIAFAPPDATVRDLPREAFVRTTSLVMRSCLPAATDDCASRFH